MKVTNLSLTPHAIRSINPDILGLNNPLLVEIEVFQELWEKSAPKTLAVTTLGAAENTDIGGVGDGC